MRKSSELTKTDVSENHQKSRSQRHRRRMAKQGVAALFQIAMAAVRSKLLSFLLKKHRFLCYRQNLEFQPGLSLTKNVKTPNSVWGNTLYLLSFLSMTSTEWSKNSENPCRVLMFLTP